jgi:hypothetical protein
LPFSRIKHFPQFYLQGQIIHHEVNVAYAKYFKHLSLLALRAVDEYLKSADSKIQVTPPGGISRLFGAILALFVSIRYAAQNKS